MYNNNIVLAEDASHLEHIIIGRGIAFNKKAGFTIENQRIEKVFVLQSKETMDGFMKLLDIIPVNYLELTNKIIENAEKNLKVTFDDSIYIGLADHLTYALERQRNGNELKNALIWEIKRFYTAEFKAAIEALEIIRYYENVTLSEDEAAFIALHFVNGLQDGEDMQQTVIATEIIREIATIIRYQFRVELDVESINYARFVSHLRFFLRRVFQKDYNTEVDNIWYSEISKKTPDVSACVDKIAIYLEQRIGVKIHNEEKFYLILHVNRILQEK